MSELKQLTDRASDLIYSYRHVCDLVKTSEDRKKQLAQDHEDAIQAQESIQGIAQTIQQQAHRRIANVVTRCLEAVFEDEAYEFEIEFDRKRGKTEAKLLFKRDGETFDPLTSSGGGAVDVAAFALRLACIILARPERRRLLVMDEPFRFLSKEYRPRMRMLLKTLAKEMDVQFVMVTHIEDFEVGKVVLV